MKQLGSDGARPVSSMIVDAVDGKGCVSAMVNIGAARLRL